MFVAQTEMSAFELPMSITCDIYHAVFVSNLSCCATSSLEHMMDLLPLHAPYSISIKAVLANKHFRHLLQPNHQVDV